jgi:predicted dehydrogenase
MSDKLRLGFMGTTFPCLRHAGAFNALPKAELAAVADPNPKGRKAFVEEFGPMAEYADYHDMLKCAELDAVVIGLPTGLHLEASLASFDAGMHVLCEKPPATNAKEMLRVARKAKQSGLTYMFCRQFRFSAPSLQARKLVEDGRLGEVYHAEARWLRGRFIPTGARSWFTDAKRGGGVMLDLGIHTIDEAWFIMGCPRPVEVSAGMHCAFGHLAPKGQAYTADDATVGLIRFENGATLDFASTFCLNWPGKEAPPADGKAFNPQLRETLICGTHGGVQIRNGKEGSRVLSGTRGLRVSPMKAHAPCATNDASPDFYRQAKDFLSAIRNGTEPTNSIDQAVMLMQILDAIRESGRTNRAARITKPKV